MSPGEQSLESATRPRRGLAREAASAVLQFGFDRLRLSTIGAATDLPNLRSVRLLRRLGFGPAGQTSLDGRETLFFRLAGSDWRQLASEKDRR